MNRFELTCFPSRRRLSRMSGVMSGLLSGVILCALACGGDTQELAPAEATVAVVSPLRGNVETGTAGTFEALVFDTRVGDGHAIRTGQSASAAITHDLGATLILDENTEVTLSLEEVRVVSGRVFVDQRGAFEPAGSTPGSVAGAAASAGQSVVIRLGEAKEIRGDGASFSIDVRAPVPEVFCGSGELTWVSGDESGYVTQGESLVFDESPESEAARVWDDWTGGLADPAPASFSDESPIGILCGRPSIGMAPAPLSLRSHDVHATVERDFATTRVTQTFFNAESAVLRGSYKLQLPDGAIVQSFSLRRGDAGPVAGVITPIASASPGQPLWQDVSGDFRLSYDGPDQVAGDIPNITPGETITLEIVYTHWLGANGTSRSYEYPMLEASGQRSSPPLIGEFSFHLDASAAGGATAIRASHGANVNGTAVTLQRGDYRPTGDVFVEFDLPAETSARAFVVNAAPEEPSYTDAARGAEATAADRYVLIDVPTDLLELDAATRADTDVLIVVDTSGSGGQAGLELKRSALDALLRQLAPTDNVAVRVGDIDLRVPAALDDGAFVPATDANRGALLESLADVIAVGATDLGGMLQSAMIEASGRENAIVVYLGDGRPTSGDLSTQDLRARFDSIESAPRLFAVGVSENANLEGLRRLTEATFPMRDRRDGTLASMAIMSRARTPVLRDLGVDFGPDLGRVYPSLPASADYRGFLRFLGRLNGALPESITVSGRYLGEAFSVEIPLNAVARTTGMNDMLGKDVRKRWASHRMARLVEEDAGREALVDLGVRYGLLSPWTTFYSASLNPGALQDPFIASTPSQLAPVWALRFVDRAPEEFVLASPELGQELGFRRRRSREHPEPSREPPARIWEARVRPGDVAGGTTSTSDGGIRQVTVTRFLEDSRDGVDACFDRARISNPGLTGAQVLRIAIGGAGSVSVDTESGNLPEDVSRCVELEVEGLAYPELGGSVEVIWRVHTRPNGNQFVRRNCSDASRLSLSMRRDLWRQRLSTGSAQNVWNQAAAGCELQDWTSQRALLSLIMAQSGTFDTLMELYGSGAFQSFPSARAMLRRRIALLARTPWQVERVRHVFGLKANVDWAYFNRLWNTNESPEARLRLVQRWLRGLPDELDLRLKELALLEALGRVPEAKDRARILLRHEFADERIFAEVGEFMVRQGDPEQARRTFSEVIEDNPFAASRRWTLGGLYRANGWHQDAYREFSTLAQLEGNAPDALLLVARSAASLERVDEALRLEEAIAAGGAPGKFEGIGGISQLFSLTHLGRLIESGQATDAQVRTRLRRTGMLRNAPDAIVLLTWDHPTRHPSLEVNLPSTPPELPFEPAPLNADPHGLQGAIIENLSDEMVRVRVTRVGQEQTLEPVMGTLWIIEDLAGTPQIRSQAISLEPGADPVQVSFGQ